MVSGSALAGAGLVLVTGATGFIGRALVSELALRGVDAVRSTTRLSGLGKDRLGPATYVADLAPDTDWSQAVAGVAVVVHTAARVHVLNDQSADPLTEFRRVNVQGTLTLARQAAAAGVRRFIFVSSIKGSRSTVKRPGLGILTHPTMRLHRWTLMGFRKQRRKKHCGGLHSRLAWKLSL